MNRQIIINALVVKTIKSYNELTSSGILKKTKFPKLSGLEN